MKDYKKELFKIFIFGVCLGIYAVVVYYLFVK